MVAAEDVDVRGTRDLERPLGRKSLVRSEVISPGVFMLAESGKLANRALTPHPDRKRSGLSQWEMLGWRPWQPSDHSVRRNISPGLFITPLRR